MTEARSRAQQLMGDLAPKLAELTDEVLFGDVWARPGLSPRDRSLITVAALVALDRTDQLRSHLGRALDNDLAQEELVGDDHAPGLLRRLAVRGRRGRRPPRGQPRLTSSRGHVLRAEP